MSVSACVCVCLFLRISLKPHQNYAKFSVHVTCGCGSVLLWLLGSVAICYVLCFVVDVMFSHNGQGDAKKECTQSDSLEMTYTVSSGALNSTPTNQPQGGTTDLTQRCYSYSYRVSLLNSCSQRNHAVL